VKTLFRQYFNCSAAITIMLACVTGASGGTISMQIIADNDFAVFSGTDTSVTSLLYQNNVAWPDQLTNLSSLTFDLAAGETTFYVLGLGGGGNENISGTINGVDLTTIPVLMSSDIGPFLTGFEAETNSSGGGSVADGTFDASLVDVQAALTSLTWGAPTPTTGVDFVASQSPTGQGFHFDPNTAHLFQFSASDVNAESPTPEPSTLLMFIGAGVAFALGRCRRIAPRRV
jgi:hypothetical protein